MAKNLRWKVLFILGVVGLVGVVVLSARSEGAARPRPQGRRAPRAARPDRRRAAGSKRRPRPIGWREQLKTANITVGGVTVNGADVVHRERHAARSGRGVPQRADRGRRQLRPHVGQPAATPSRCKPNIVVQLREDTVNQALQTIERRVNELGVAEPIVARHSAADQILVQLPGVTDVARAKEIIRSTAQLELKQVEQGPFSDENAAQRGARQQRAARHADSSRARSKPVPASRRAPATTSCAACPR